MSTVKITQLPELSVIPGNTSNTILVGVDIPSGATTKYTVKAIADGMYANNVLNVGNNAVVFPGVIGQFVANNESYIQLNLQNRNGNGSGDIVITADTGTDTTHYIDLGLQGSTYNYPGYTVAKPLDGYLLMQGDGSSVGGNLVIGTVSSGKDIIFFQGGSEAANAVAKFQYNTGLHLLKKPLIFADGSTQNTSSEGASSYANSAFTKANSAFVDANAASSYANSAFTKANNALANTTGTFAGDLTLVGNLIASGIYSTTGPISTGNLVVTGTASISGTTNLAGQLNVVGAVAMNATVLIANSTFSATESAVTIAASGTVVTPANDGYMIHISGKNGVASRVVTDSYGTGAYSLYAGRAARGTVDSPTALQSGDVIARFSSNGYGTTKYQTLGVGRIDFIAAENFTDANTGSQIKFWNCSVGSNTLQNIATFNGDSAQFSGYIEPQKGFVYTPRVPAGNQTAITINYATDSMIKANCAADLVVSHSSFVAGKVVEMWLVNNSVTGHTITHGLSAINSTTNSTTFTIPSTSSAHLKFFSIDGDLANTFVSINYA